MHQGVYVPVTPQTQPNPYLIDPLRDLEVDEKLKLTKINPAYMTRQLSDISETSQEIFFRITSLNPVRPQNRPSDREKTALISFKKKNDVSEVGEFFKDESRYSFFYMAPLKVNQSCITCHTEQATNIGKVMGGISVTLKNAPQILFLPTVIGHVAMGMTGLILIAFLGFKINSAYKTIQLQSIMDSLTGIPNRRYFSERIVLEQKRSERENQTISVILSDIDHFKKFNDSYGHQAGDECLKQVASTIKNTLNRSTDFCARYGGEEFIIVLPNTPLDGALIVAEKIRREIESLKILHQDSKTNKFLTISLGVATDETHTKSWEDLIRGADKALYQSKANGRNRVEYFSDGSISEQNTVQG